MKQLKTLQLILKKKLFKIKKSVSNFFDFKQIKYFDNKKYFKKIIMFSMVFVILFVYSMTDIFSSDTTIYPTIVNSDSNTNVNLWSKDQSKDLWELFDKDKISSSVRVIRNWLVNMLKEWVENIPSDQTTNIQTTTTDNNTIVLNTNTTNTTVSTLPDNFTDISKDTNKNYINFFASNKIIFKNKKFYPSNDTKLFDFVKIVVNTYRWKLWYDLTTQVWLTTETTYNFQGFDVNNNKIINTAFELWILNWVNVGWTWKDLKFNMPINSKIVNQILNNLAEEYPSLTNSNYIEDIPKTTFIINRSSVLKHIALAFKIEVEWQTENNIVNETVNVSQNNYYFDDTKVSKYGNAVEQLAKLGIINNQNRVFGVDRYITRQDFVIMFTKAYLYKNNKTVKTDDYLQTQISDIENNQNAVYLVYWEKNNLIDYLLESTRWKTYIYPSKLLTKHEAYYIIKQNLWINIIYPEDEADKQNISRWEIAQLIYDSFQIWWNSNNTNSSNNLNQNNSSDPSSDSILVWLGKLFLNKL